MNLDNFEKEKLSMFYMKRNRFKTTGRLHGGLSLSSFQG